MALTRIHHISNQPTNQLSRLLHPVYHPATQLTQPGFKRNLVRDVRAFADDVKAFRSDFLLSGPMVQVGACVFYLMIDCDGLTKRCRIALYECTPTTHLCTHTSDTTHTYHNCRSENII